MTKKQRLALMGQIVTVTKGVRVIGDSTGYTRLLLPYDIQPEIQRAGWVVGFRNALEGKKVWGGYDDPNTFEVTKAIPVMLVSYWPTEAPVKVPLDGFVMGGTPALAYIRESDKEWMRENAQTMSRDAKGRFVSP